MESGGLTTSGRAGGTGEQGPRWAHRAGILAATAAALAIGLWFLSRFVAETRDASFIIGAIWVAVVGAGVFAYARSRPEIRRVALGGFAAMVVGVAVIGWWTGVRETTVDEQVAVATQSATGAERDAALAGDGGGDSSGAAANGNGNPTAGGGGNGSGSPAAGAEGSGGEQSGQKANGQKQQQAKGQNQSSGPVLLSKGPFQGVDGHDGKGDATYVKDGNDRKVTFTNFKVDPGPNVVVWLTKNPNDLDDRIELGKMKGSSGSQQYSIPNDANLSKYDTVVLYCTPFTVRVAVAELS